MEKARRDDEPIDDLMLRQAQHEVCCAGWFAPNTAIGLILSLSKDEAGPRTEQNEQLGFHDGWNKATDQLVELVKAM